jgi:hypothetical protein
MKQSAQGSGESIIIEKVRLQWLIDNSIGIIGQPLFNFLQRLVVAYDISC